MAESRDSTNNSSIIPFPEPPAKAVPFDAAGPFVFVVRARTEVTGGTSDAPVFRRESVLVDPDAELKDDCLIIAQYRGDLPRMYCWRRTGRDENGRFIRAGDPNEYFSLKGYFRYKVEDLDRGLIRILGCVVGEPRRI